MKARVKKNLVIVSLMVASFLMVGMTGQLVAAAEKFPNKPVQIVVPFKPGGGADRTTRLFAPYFSKELGVPVNVINISGGGGWVAWSQMAKWDAKKDDHILGVINPFFSGNFSTPHAFPNFSRIIGSVTF